ncbi:hypothetical protein KC19_9G057700 [Ceratodon purpureus]|uniref:Uncharacterized protein n=1 Tax=Ceratodon purpureus TaxID=3225 RepID=A0A8T0GUJ5_CERPU|nr:hypothetical protein KC19_9G057700 [Ceratodon purpureus]
MCVEWVQVGSLRWNACREFMTDWILYVLRLPFLKYCEQPVTVVNFCAYSVLLEKQNDRDGEKCIEKSHRDHSHTILFSSGTGEMMRFRMMVRSTQGALLNSCPKFCRTAGVICLKSLIPVCLPFEMPLNF